MLNLYEVSIVFADGSQHTGQVVEESAILARKRAVKLYVYYHAEWTKKLMVGTITRAINYDL